MPSIRLQHVSGHFNALSIDYINPPWNPNKLGTEKLEFTTMDGKVLKVPVDVVKQCVIEVIP